MPHLPTHEPPPLQAPPPIRLPQQRLHLVRCPRAQTRDIAIEHQTKRDQGDEVGEDELDGLVVEVDGGEDGDEGPEEEDGDEAGEGAGLELEDPRYQNKNRH